MKILFFASGCLPFAAKTLEQRPLGGLETAVIHLSAALKEEGHQVIVVTSERNPPLSDPLYLPFNAWQDIGPVDALIAVREWTPLFLALETKIRLFWTGDSYDQPHNIGIGDKRVAKATDCLLPVSNWHGKRLCQEAGFPQKKVYVLKNGVKLDQFAGTETRVRKRLIYSSTPYRGLALLPQIFLETKKRHPEAELHIFSGFDVYRGNQDYSGPAVDQYEALKEHLLQLPDCFLHGNVLQSVLAREFMKSAVLVYPNTFEETSCITALEAQAAGCPIITSRLGALPETVGSAGILIPPPPGTTRYTELFIEALDTLLSDDALLASLGKNGLERAKSFSWSVIARGFAGWLENSLALKRKKKK